MVAPILASVDTMDLTLHDDLAEVPAATWDALLAQQAQPTPFMRHAYLLALAESGSAQVATGWDGQVLALRRGPELLAATPIYAKTHSYGEYVFDWAWADAYARHGLAYYPKQLVAVPFTPVTGSRLLAVGPAERLALLRGVQHLARVQDTSAHLLFGDAADLAAAREAGWLLRSGVQFHWQNRAGTPYADMADFLASLHREKRKKILQERRRVAEVGVTFTVHEGAQITPALWDFFYACYVQTYAEHRSTPYLSRDFFARMAADMPAHWLLFVAHQAGQPVAASLLAIDRAQGVAWGRYWGALAAVPLLHFEAAYYQPLAWCIAQGFTRFEGGAQGEHKLARGLLPVATASAHWLAHPAFARAVEDFLAREGGGVAAYLDELREHSPYRSPNPA